MSWRLLPFVVMVTLFASQTRTDSSMMNTSTVPVTSGVLCLVVAQQEECHPDTPCVEGTSCLPVASSLPPVNVNRTVQSGWETAGGSCGTRRCYLILRCACGPPLASETCN